MASLESIVKGMETALRILLPAVKEAVDEYKALKVKVEAGEEISEEEWRERDARWEEAYANLEALLGPIPEEGEV